MQLGPGAKKDPEAHPSPGGNLTLQAGVGKETEPSLSLRLGKLQISILQDAFPALRCFGDHGGRDSEHWLAGAGEHVSMSSIRSPKVSKPKRWLTRESYRMLQGPLAFLLPTGFPSPLLLSWFRSAVPLPAGGSPFLLFQRKGLPRGLRASQSYTYQSCERQHWKPAPPTHTLRRRLQVEKSPVGAAAEMSAPEYLQEGNLSTRLPAPWRPGTLHL